MRERAARERGKRDKNEREGGWGGGGLEGGRMRGGGSVRVCAREPVRACVRGVWLWGGFNTRTRDGRVSDESFAQARGEHVTPS